MQPTRILFVVEVEADRADHHRVAGHSLDHSDKLAVAVEGNILDPVGEVLEISDMPVQTLMGALYNS